jgi:hypothetical protein
VHAPAGGKRLQYEQRKGPLENVVFLGHFALLRFELCASYLAIYA